MNESYIYITPFKTRGPMLDITPVKKNLQCFTFYSFKRPNYNLR